MLFEEAEQIGFFLRELIHLTLLRRLVGPPAEQFRAMAETIARHVIIANFDDKFRLEGVPDILLSLIPSAWSPRSGTREAGWCGEFFEFLRESRPVGDGYARSEANVMQQTVRIIETKEEGTDGFLAFSVTKSAKDAIGREEALDQLH